MLPHTRWICTGSDNGTPSSRTTAPLIETGRRVSVGRSLGRLVVGWAEIWDWLWFGYKHSQTRHATTNRRMRLRCDIMLYPPAQYWTINPVNDQFATRL